MPSESKKKAGKQERKKERKWCASLGGRIFVDEEEEEDEIDEEEEEGERERIRRIGGKSVKILLVPCLTGDSRIDDVLPSVGHGQECAPLVYQTFQAQQQFDSRAKSNGRQRMGGAY